EQSGAAAERSGAGKSEQDRYRDCLESLGRLRQQIQPDEEMWFAYLRCLNAADSMSAQFECLAPLTELQNQQTPNAEQPSRCPAVARVATRRVAGGPGGPPDLRSRIWGGCFGASPKPLQEPGDEVPVDQVVEDRRDELRPIVA